MAALESSPLLLSGASKVSYNDAEKRIVFHQISYEVSEGLCTKSSKTILDDVS